MVVININHGSNEDKTPSSRERLGLGLDWKCAHVAFSFLFFGAARHPKAVARTNKKQNEQEQSFNSNCNDTTI
ncbi:hypothetical protein ACLKA7_011958 [Drosophila subpalustris]